MEITSSTDNSSTTKPLVISDTSSTTTSSTANTSSTTDASSFESFMKTALTGMGKAEVSEEELFASLIEQRLTELNSEAGAFYATEKAKFMSSMAKADGHVPMEDVALAALNSTVAAGKVTEEDAMKINGESFLGAQLDSDLENLFDDKGGENDPTKAVASVDEAMNKLKLFMDGMKAGTLKVSNRELSAGATGGHLVGGGSSSDVSSLATGSGTDITGSQAMDGSGGFVWKPVSDSDGNLVVLLPTEFRGLIDKVEIHSSLPPSEATKLGEGKFSGDEDNGARPHFRFSKPGAEYGDNIHVVGYKSDGSTVTWSIDDGGQRHD